MKKGRKKGRKVGFNGQYCTGCGSVWEMAVGKETVGVVTKHPDFPSYGLEREQCPSCKEPQRSFKELPGTLARERHKKLLQRISTDNPKLFKKNVGNGRTK